MAEAQKIPLSLRKGYLRANLLYILDDVLKTYIFVTADYLAEQYKIVFQTPLETALQTCDADLFSFIQDEFADTFFVHQESDPRGFLRRTGINKPLPVTQNAPTKAIGYEKSAVSPVPRAVEVDLDYDSGSQYSRPSSRAPIVTEELCSSPSASSLNTSRADLIIEQHITVPKEEPADFVEELRTDFANVGIGTMRSRTRSQSSKEGVAPVPEVSADISLSNKVNASIPIPASGSARKSLSVDTPPPGFGMPQKPPGFEIPQKPPGFEMPQKRPGFGMLQKPPGFNDVAPVRTPSATSASASTVDVNENQDENVQEETERKASPDDTAGLLKFLEDVNKKHEKNEREANGAENVRQTAEIGETAYSPQDDTSPENDRHGGDQTPDLVRTTKPYYDPDFEEDYDDYAVQNGPVVNGYAANDDADDVRASSPQSFKKEESPVIQSKRVTELHYKLDDGYIEIYDSIYRHKKQLVSKIMEKWGNESIPTSWLSITHLGDVLAILRRLNKLYPDGCTAMELYEFDNTLRTSNDSAISSLPSMACVIENGMLEVENQRFHVGAQALNTGIIQLRKNLCSNLYRILRNHNNTLRVKNVIESWNELVCMSFAKPAETIIKVCNRYPLVFQLKSNRAEQYCFETSSLYITEGLSDWRVVLDCEINDMPGILCDCAKCM